MNIEQEVKELRHHEKILIEAIEKLGKRVGIIDPEAFIDGPTALMICDDIATYIDGLEIGNED